MVEEKYKKPYGLVALKEFAKTIILSRRVEGHKVLSALIVGLPDTGKSDLLLCFAPTKGIFVATDLTGYGLGQHLQDIVSGNIKFIVMPDLARMLEGRKSAGLQFIRGLQSLCEEGIFNVTTYHSRFYSPTPVRCGFIAALTSKSFGEEEKGWIASGFLSRVVPFFLGYTKEDIDKALGTIKNEEDVFQKESLDLTSPPINVIMTKGQKDYVELVAKFVAGVNQDFTCFRSLKNMICFTKAHAIYRGDTVVNMDDINFLESLIPFWYNPAKRGTDCDYYLLRSLPASIPELLSILPYSSGLVYDTVRHLKNVGLISESEGKLISTFKFKPRMYEVYSDIIDFSGNKLRKEKAKELINRNGGLPGFLNMLQNLLGKRNVRLSIEELEEIPWLEWIKEVK
jgi:hypothetical protein